MTLVRLHLIAEVPSTPDMPGAPLPPQPAPATPSPGTPGPETPAPAPARPETEPPSPPHPGPLRPVGGGIGTLLPSGAAVPEGLDGRWRSTDPCRSTAILPAGARLPRCSSCTASTWWRPLLPVAVLDPKARPGRVA